MPATECGDCDKLQQALMLKFRMNLKGFREKFRGSAPFNGELCSQFVTRLRNFLERWVDLWSGEELRGPFRVVLERTVFVELRPE